MKLVYIAGPYRGPSAWVVAENVREAERHALTVAQHGAMPVCPHAMTAHFDGQLDDDFWLEGSSELLRRSDGIWMLPRWRDSAGASAEHELARELGLEVFHATNVEHHAELSRWARGEGRLRAAGCGLRVGAEPECCGDLSSGTQRSTVASGPSLYDPAARSLQPDSAPEPAARSPQPAASSSSPQTGSLTSSETLGCEPAASEGPA